MKQVYNEQKVNNINFDWINQLKEDFIFIEEEFTEEYDKKNSKTEYKIIVEQKVRNKVFAKLKETQRKHIKVSEICYNTFKVQEYMSSHILTNNEVSLLFGLRSRTLRSIKN